MSPLKLAYLSLSRRKVTTIIAIISISLAVGFSGVLLRTNILAQSRFENLGRGGDAIVGAKSGGIEILLGSLRAEGPYPGLLPFKLFQTLRAEQNIRFEDGVNTRPSFISSVIPILQFGKFQEARVTATDESFVQRPRAEDSFSFQEGRWVFQGAEVVLGSAAAEKYNLKVGSQIDVKVWMGDKVFSPLSQTLQVVGIFNSTGTAWDQQIFTSLPIAHALIAKLDLNETSIWGSDVLNYFLVYLKPNGFKDLSALINNRTVGQAIEVNTEVAKLKELVGVGQDLGFFVTGLVLILGGLSVASMLITRFDAMSSQLAVLRALGYRKSELGSWLLWEGFLLGLSSACLGLLLDAALFPFVQKALAAAMPGIESLSSSLWLSYPVWLTAIVATMLSVIVPLYRVYHQNVHYSLRG